MNQIELNHLEEKQTSKFKRLGDVLITIFSKPSGMIGFSIVILHIIIAIISPLIVPYDYKEINSLIMLKSSINKLTKNLTKLKKNYEKIKVKDKTILDSFIRYYPKGCTNSNSNSQCTYLTLQEAFNMLHKSVESKSMNINTNPTSVRRQLF